MTLIQILENRQKPLTVREVAELLGVSKRHIYEMVADGRLPGFRVGHSIRIEVADLAGLLRNRKSDAVQAQKIAGPRKHFSPRGNRQEKRSAEHFLRKRVKSLEIAVATGNLNWK